MTIGGTLLAVHARPRAAGRPGLPKPAVPALVIAPSGAEGDYNYYRARKLNDDPAQAILIVTEDVLTGLNAEGWPVRSGDLGENLTVRVAEAALIPGSRIRIGRVTLEITLACEPCTELYTLPYVGKERGPEFLKTMLGRRGWYAKVITAGKVVPGMSVTVATPVTVPPVSNCMAVQ